MQGDAPVLPWAANTAIDSLPAEPPVEADLPSSRGLALGAGLEVKWELVDDASGERQVKWWGATLVEQVPGQTDGEGRQVYLLRYTADPAAGYDEESINKVTFLGDHHLYDLGEDEELPWRRAGESWDDEAMGEGGAAAAEGEQAMTLREVEAHIRRGERRRGRTVEEDTVDLLKSLPADQQRVVAEGFRELTDCMAEGIKALYVANGPNYVVTADDIHRLREEAGKRLQQRVLRGNP